MKTLKSIIFVGLFASTINQTFALNFVSLEEAVKKGFVNLIIKSKGGYLGEVIEMKVKNTSNRPLDFKLETGRKLDSKNNNEQDILVTKPEEFSLCSNQTKTIKVTGMCCQAHNLCPHENADYSIGRMADSNLIKLATFIDQNKYYANFSAQQAVWAVSDNNSLGSITDGNRTVVETLRRYVSKLTGKVIPPYEVSYVRNSEREVQGRARTIDGTFDYALPVNAHVTIGIYDENGVLVQALFQNIEHQRGNYKLYFTFRTLNLPSGVYYAKMKTNGSVGKEMKIEF